MSVGHQGESVKGEREGMSLRVTKARRDEKCAVVEVGARCNVEGDRTRVSGGGESIGRGRGRKDPGEFGGQGWFL